jgi:hypothetical protein
VKLKSAKFANSIKVGQLEITFGASNAFDLDLEGWVIKVTDLRSNATSSTTVFNTIYWVEDEGERSSSTVLPGAGTKGKKDKPA